MATYSITFRSNDPHSPINGDHVPVASGAAFVAEYADTMDLEYNDGDDCACIAADIDALAIGCSLAVEGGFGELATVTRIA
jgi:hypothetical protein